MNPTAIVPTVSELTEPASLVAPEVTAVSINSGDGFTRVTGNTVRVSFSDATSGVQYVTLAGDIADGEKIAYSVTDADRTAGYKDIAVTL